MTPQDRLAAVLNRVAALSRVTHIRVDDDERAARNGDDGRRSDGLDARIAGLEESVSRLEEVIF